MDTVVVDLDVLTIAFWDKKDERKADAQRFLERVREGEFELYTPLLLFQQVHEWKHGELSADIADFFFRHAEDLIDVRELEAAVEERTGNLVSTVLEEAMDEIRNVKESDMMLVLYASRVDADYLVTYDKKHLVGKRDEINRFLESKGLHQMEIVTPDGLD